MFQLAKHVHPKFQLNFYPDGLEQIFDIFPGKFMIFHQILKKSFKNFQNQASKFMYQLAKHVHAKFHLSSFHPDGLRQIWTFLQEKLKI
jgi:hypothetical protein